MTTEKLSLPASEARYCKAVYWVKIRGKAVPVLPALSLVYFAIAVACMAIALFAADRLIVLTEPQGTLATIGWEQENQNILLMDEVKVQNSDTDSVWRSNGFPFPGPKDGRKRILVIGDSFVWGDGYVNMNDTWWRQLQRELDERGYWNVDVVAAGRNGASTQDEFGWLRDQNLISRLQPDAIVIGYVTNDPDMRDPQGNKYVPQTAEQPASPGTAQLPLLDQALGKEAPEVAEQIQQRANAKSQAGSQSDRVGSAPSDWEVRILEGPNFEAYKQMVGDMGTFLKQQGVPYFFVSLPNFPDRNDFQAKYDKVEPVFKAAGIPFYNILDDLMAAVPRLSQAGNVLQWGINPANSHPTQALTHFYAQEVADILEKDYPGVLGQSQSVPPVLRPRINDWTPAALDVRETGAGEWTFDYPTNQELALNLPLNKEHVALNFDLPVAVKQIKLSGDGLLGAEMYVTTVDAEKGFDPGTPYSLGEQKGGDLSWTVQGQPFAQRINSLMISAQMKTSPKPDRVIDLKPSQMRPEQGLAYTYMLPELTSEADDEMGPKSLWVLLEDGKPLGPAHSEHADIRALGKGRWSHWKEAVYFSSSDGSDPRTNGKQYLMTYTDPQKMSLKLDITFDDPAVRP